MKFTSYIFFVLALSALFTSCGKDNYDAPNATLAGRIVYQGKNLHLRGTGEAVQLQLYQDGYAKRDPIPVFVGQDGHFAAALFPGEYKLVTRDGNGPWVNNRDTVLIKMTGHTTVDLEVTPFFTIEEENISLSGTTLTASFTIKQVVPEAKIQRVMLIVSKTQFADDVNNLFRKDFLDIAPEQLNLNTDMGDNKDIINAKALYGRIGVQAIGADQAIYSPVIRLK